MPSTRPCTARRSRPIGPASGSYRLTVEALEVRHLLSLQAVSLADSALFGASADGVSDSPSISADGQLVAFESTADNLVDNPTGGFNEQVYVGSAAGGPARLVSANASGAGGNGNSTDPVLSADGSEVVFLSDATDLVPEQVAAGTHLYETDLQSGTTTLVDVNTSGVGAVDNVDKAVSGADGTYIVENTPSVSADGRYVVFTATATGLTSGPAVSSGTITNVYVRDTVAGTTTLVSADVAGSDGGNGNSGGATISADGSEVVFQSDASNLVATDTNNATDVFVRNLTTGVTSLVSANISNTDSGDFESYGPVLSGDGNHVAFLSHADDLQSVHSHNLAVNVYERDLTTGVTTLISINTAGTDSLVSNSSQLAVNDDGRYVAYVTGNPPQVYVRDTQAGTTALASVNLAGMPDANGGNLNNPTLSADGQVVAFVYTANDLVSLPTNGQQSVFIRNLTTGVTTLVSVNAAGTAGGDNESNSTIGQGGTADGPVVLSPDGTKVAFVSHADDLVANDNNNLADVFVRDLAAGTTTLVSSRAPIQPAAYTSHGPTYLGAISADGNSVAMNGGGADLAATSGAGLIESVNNAAVSDLQTGALSAFGPSTDLTNSSAGATVLSADGSVLAFQDNTFSPVFGLVENIYTAAVPGGAPVLASVNATGTGPGNANSFSPVLSGDGGTVVFSSEATDLVPDFVEGNSAGIGLSGTGLDLFARNLKTGVTTLVSINAAGTASGNGGSGSTVDDPALSGKPGGYSYSLSADGRYVAFASNATDLTAIDTSANGGGIYVRDLQAGTTQLVDVAADGTSAANGAPFGSPVISADGRYVVFISNATNLVAGLNLPADNSYAYVRDLQTETTRLVSVDSLGNPIGADGVPSISADGQVVTFASLDIGGQAGAVNEIYAYEAATGSAQLVSVNAAGAAADSPANSYHTNIEDDSVVSAGGRYVLFASTADNLAPGSFDGSENLYVRDLQTNTTTLVSANRFGTGGGTALPQDRQQNLNPGVNNFAISADGSTIAFSSDQYDLVQGETYPTSSSDQYYLVLGGPSPTSNVFVSTQSVTPPTVGAIGGQVFDDVNGNGTLDPGESGLSGWTVFLDLGGSGQFAAGDPTAITDANGDYTFNNLTPGTYTVGEIVQAGYDQTAPPAPGTASVVVVAGQRATGPSFGDELLSPDLTVQSISVPASAQPGQPASPLSYTVVNKGGGAATGDWQDAVYLSTKTTIDATATLLAVLPQTGGLAPGASYTQSLTNVPLPILPAGSYYLLVQVDRRGQVSEPAASKAAEFAASTTPIAFAIPTVTVGTPATGSFMAAGQDQIYQVTVAAGQNLVLTLDSQASAGALALLAQFGALPAAGQASTLTATDFTPNEQLVIAPTQAGTYFIDVHSQSGAAASAGFTLTATTPGLELLGSSPGAVGNGGTATIEVDGTGFTPATTFALVGSGGPIAAQSSQFVSGSEVFATFDLTGQPIGSYTIQATGQGGTSVSLPAALTVQPGVAASIVTSLSVPAQTRVGRVYSFVVIYKNPGNNDVPAPLLQIQSPNETDIGLAPDALGMENYTIQVLGISPSGPAGILGPGQQGSVTVYFQSVAGDNQFTVAANTTADTTAVDYSILSMELNPGLLSDAQWNAIFANFQQEVGPTTGDYVAMLDQNATLLPPALGDNALAIDVAEFQIDRAQAAIGPSITGTLQTSSSQVSLAGQTVIATNSTTGDVFTTTSLNDGSFIFDSVTPGSYDFSVDGALISGTPTATVAASQAVQDVALDLSLGGAITGVVATAVSGVAVADPTITAVAEDGTTYSVTGADDGVYSLTGLEPGTYTIDAQADGFAQASAAGIVVSGDSHTQDFSLAPQAVITGTVNLAPGGPTGGTPVSVTATVSGDSSPVATFLGTVTGSGFAIPGLPAGTYDLTITQDGYVTQTLTGVTVAAAGSTDVGAVDLALSASISGTVTSTDPNTPAAYAEVGAFSGTTLVAAAVADASGDFTIDGLPAGTYSLGVAGAAGTVTAPTLTVVGGDQLTGVTVTVTVIPPPGIQPDQVAYTPAEIRQMLAEDIAEIKTVEGPIPQLIQHAMNLLNGIMSEPPCPMADAAKKLAIMDLNDVINDANQYLTDSKTIRAQISNDISNIYDDTAVEDVAIFDAADATVGALGDVLTDLKALTANAVGDYAKFLAKLLDCSCMSSGSGSASPSDIMADAAGGMGCMAPEPPPNPSKPAPQGQGSSQGGSGFDPNELTGPGVGAAGYVAAGQALPYEVGFENEPTATATTQEVTVTETLASDLDLTTFQLGAITFGSTVIAVPAALQSYSTTVDTTNTDGTALQVDVTAGLDLNTGVVTWTFRSVDPATGQLPAGVDDGLLPPEDGTGRGTGSVGYTILPLTSLADGASFTSAASVVFDTNAPIATNTVTNTIDDVAPSSSVLALPASSPSQFTVSWSGTDPASGSGVAVYDVYVSTDGGPSVPFQTGTTATSATFTGVPGNTYGFFSVASDAVGNTQQLPTTAQATTQVIAPNPMISGAASATVGEPYVLSLSASGPGSGTITGWTITWGDGDVQPIAGNPASVTHVYSQPGTDTISASATTPVGTIAAGQNVVVTVVAATKPLPPPPPPPPPLVTVQSVLPETVHLKHKKTEKVLVVTFSGALEQAAADILADYHLVVPAKSKKPVHGTTPPGKKVALVSAVYNASGSKFTVTLTPKAKLPTGPLQLTITAAGTLDAEGRALDGNRDGQPGGDFVATFKAGGIILADG